MALSYRQRLMPLSERFKSAETPSTEASAPAAKRLAVRRKAKKRAPRGKRGKCPPPAPPAE